MQSVEDKKRFVRDKFAAISNKYDFLNIDFVDILWELTADGKVRHPKPRGGTEWCSAFTAELQVAVDGVKTGEEPRLLSGALARDALKLCYQEAKSIATGRAVSIN